MKDRLIFKTTKLKNGIRVYAKPTDVPFAYAWLYIPVGHANNIGKVLPGTAHFLEHLVFSRSRLYPEQDQFQKKIELKGGYFNAATSTFQTEFYLTARSDMFTDAFKGLMSHVFDPIIEAKDVLHEASIISNEAKRKSKWYPGGSELGNHCLAKWKHRALFSMRQKIGKDVDLKKMSVTRLSEFHKAYFDPGVYLIIGGNFDQKVVSRELSKIKTKKHDLPKKFEQIRWAHKAYHEKKVDDINHFLYHVGGIVAEHDLMTMIGIDFIGHLLTNDTHGVLVEWLRKERGWCYNVDFDSDCFSNPLINSNWELCIPLNTYKQVEHVRKELHGRILEAISDKALVAMEVERQKSCQLFSYETLDSIMSEADGMIGIYGRMYTEADHFKAIEQCKDIKFLKKIYDKYWSPKVTGEFLAMPK